MKHISFEFKNEQDFKDKIFAMDKPSACSVLVQFYTSVVDKSLLIRLAQQVKHHIKQAKIVGCTTNGEISQGQPFERSSIVSFTFFDSSQAIVFFTAVTEGNEQSIGRQLASEIIQSSAALKGVLLLATPMSFECQQFLLGFNEQIGNVPIFGGGAGDYFEMENSLVLGDEEVISQGVVAVALSGTNLQLQIHSTLGWTAFGPQMKVTCADVNTIYQIDHKPAGEVYQHYIGKVTGEILSDALSFPLIIERNGEPIARVPVALQDDQSLLFVADVHAHELVRFGYGDMSVILEDVAVGAEQMQSFAPEAIYLFSCGCRSMFFGADVVNELVPFEAIAPTAGFFTYGEFLNNKPASVLNTAYLIIGMREQEQGNYAGKKLMQAPSESSRKAKGMARLMHFISTVTNELEVANKELQHMAHIDALTQVMNRRRFDEAIAQEASRCVRYDRAATVILMDIDHFKAVNDNYGHQTGDQVLKNFANIVKAAIRTTDVLARYGGEEFILILPDTGLEQGTLLAERIRESIENETIRLSNKQLPSVTSSFGVSVLSAKAASPELVIAKADKALYRAKGAGRNCVMVN